MRCGQKEWVDRCILGFQLQPEVVAVLALSFSDEGQAVRRLSPSPAGQLTAEWNKALRGEGIKQDSTRWVTILRVLLPTKAAFWQEVGRRCELVNTKPYMQVRQWPLEEWGVHMPVSAGAGQR